MFQYQGMLSSNPVLSLRPSEGARKPVLRCGPIGKLKAGTARIGTPLKSSTMPRAVPMPASRSRRMLRARIAQLSSPGGQLE